MRERERERERQRGRLISCVRVGATAVFVGKQPEKSDNGNNKQ